MQITLSSKEFDEAVSLWLKEQGFSASSYDISTRVLVGRGDNPLGTRLEIQLDVKSFDKNPIDPSLAHIPIGKLGEAKDSLMDPQIATGVSVRKFGQGHADEQ